jgi:hypothetical protein
MLVGLIDFFANHSNHSRRERRDNIMTLDEAIKREEEMADCCEFEADMFDLHDPHENYLAGEYGKTVKECRQRAEWFRELKRLRKLDRALDKIEDEIAQMDFNFDNYCDNTETIVEMVCGVIDKYKKENEE